MTRPLIGPADFGTFDVNALIFIELTLNLRVKTVLPFHPAADDLCGWPTEPKKNLSSASALWHTDGMCKLCGISKWGLHFGIFLILFLILDNEWKCFKIKKNYVQLREPRPRCHRSGAWEINSFEIFVITVDKSWPIHIFIGPVNKP